MEETFAKTTSSRLVRSSLECFLTQASTARA